MNIVRYCTIFSLILLMGISACGSDEQGPEIDWGKIIGSTGYDSGQALAITADSGYIVIGYTDSYFQGAVRIYIIRLDRDGDTLWTDTYGSVECQGYAVTRASDGNYVIAGYADNAGNGDVVLVKIDDEGSVFWEKTYGGTESDIAFSCTETADGGFIVAGWTVDDSTMDKDVYLIKTDGNGDTLWTRTYGGDQEDFATSVYETSDNGFIICGWTDSFGAGSDDVYLIRTDSNGDTIWTHTYGDHNQDYGEAVIETVNNTYVVAGVTQDADEAMSRIMILSVDSEGDTLWVQTYDDGFAYDVQQTTDNGFILTGGHFNNFPYRNAYLLKTDASGGIMWEKSLGGDVNEVGFAVLQTHDGGYIIVGETESFGAGSRDVYIMKTVVESE